MEIVDARYFLYHLSGLQWLVLLQVAQEPLYDGFAFLEGFVLFIELARGDEEVFEKVLLVVETVRESNV